MAEMSKRGLVALALGTFHASVLSLTLVVLVYGTGGLGQALGGLGTVPGLGLFAALWATSLWSTSRGLRGLSLGPSLPTALRRGLLWGGVNGLLFLVILTVPFALAVVIRAESVAQAAAVLALYPLAGAGFAFVIGALVGCLFALVDRALLGVAAVFAPERTNGWARDESAAGSGGSGD